MNLGILLYYKYFNFFCENINALFSALELNPFVFTKVLLPIGVSFVILQKMTYCLDIAKGQVKPAKRFFDLVEYLFLFPAIIAGPIIKFGEVAEQIHGRIITWEKFIYGFERFAVGLFKKVWIADVLAKYADNCFNAPEIPWDYAWIGAIAYTFQIFFDFAAYSDMAIGMLSMMGFKIGENFNMPYISKSVTEFWKRWHISLTSWLREYLYFPLGGNRKGTIRTYVNQWLVFLVSGFWHGAAWNYVFWGAYHGTIMCTEKAFILKKTERIPKALRWLTTFLLVMIGWVFFRAKDISAGFAYVRDMFNFTDYYYHIDSQYIMVIDNRGWCMFALAAVISFVPLFEKPYAAVKRFFSNKHKTIAIVAFALFALAALKIITAAVSPFIYFMF
jgi:alginate O-acetyltransferase complex protein AlgI